MRKPNTLVVLTLTAFALLASPAFADPKSGDVHRIKNAWEQDQDGPRSDRFLTIELGQLEARQIELGWESAMWTLEPVGNTGMVRIRNQWRPDHYIHIENGVIEAGPIKKRWQSAMWELERVEGTSTYRLRNLWKRDHYMHVENGKLEAGPIKRRWHSARWSIQPL